MENCIDRTSFGRQRLFDFPSSLINEIQDLKGLSRDIKFTMELEDNSSIPFLDVLINMKEDGNLGHAIYRKKTHTKNYLHTSSNHHPT
jgi:hypothetical protein